MYWYVLCARVAMCSCCRPRAKCLSNYFAQLSAGRACVFILSHCKSNWRSRSWRRTTAASLTVCLYLSNCSRQQQQAATSRQGMPATWRDTPATSTAASPSSVNKEATASRAKKPLRKLMWQTCATAATPTAHITQTLLNSASLSLHTSDRSRLVSRPFCF